MRRGGAVENLNPLEPEAVDELRSLWNSDIPEYWRTIHAYADELGLKPSEVSDLAWRGTAEHTAFWRNHPRRR